MAIRETNMYCHDCNDSFVAELDMDINGNHEIECPHCGHIHYRVIQDGHVTGERYRSSMGMVQANTWTSSGTSSSSTYLNSSWNDSTNGSYSIQYNN